MEAMKDPKTLLRQALASLTNRDFSSSHSLADEALRSDPDAGLASEARRILAVAGVLLAGSREDLYGVLRISAAESEDSQLVWSRYAELAETLAKPELNDVTFAQEAYDLTFHAFSVLSDPEKKRKYDTETANDVSPPPPTSFWTVCPYCFWLFQYGKEYEECCLRCQNCSRAFHGVSVGEPPAEVVVPGKDQYFMCYGIFPVGYKGEEKAGDQNGGEGGMRRTVTKIRARRQMENVKSVARKKKADVTKEASESEESDVEVVFYEGDGDLFVGLEDIKTPL